MKNIKYENQLLDTFNNVKQIIKENKRVPIIDTKHEYKTEVNFTRPTGKDVEIYSISLHRYITSEYIRISGVNVLFYLVCLYMRDVLIQKGTYCEEKTKKLKILKSSNFIFEENDNGFWYYSIAEIKEIGAKEGFFFDLPKLTTTVDIEEPPKI